MDIKEVMLQYSLSVFFVKKYSGDTVTRANKSAIESRIMLNQQLAEELHNYSEI